MRICTWIVVTLAVSASPGCKFDTMGIAGSADGGSDAAGIDARVAIDARATTDAMPIDAAAPPDAPGAPDAHVEPPYVAYWSFDVDATDATANHDGVLTGGAAITTGGQGFGGGEALALSANGDRVDVGNPTTFDFNGDFTWHVYLKTTDGSGALLSRNPAGSDWNQGSKALFVRNDDVQWDTGWVGNPTTNAAVTDGEWHQVIVTFETASNTLEIFVDPNPGDTAGDFDGVHEVDAFDEHTHVHNDGIADTGLSIGQANFTGGLASLDTLIGLIDEVAIFDRALTGAELEQLISFGPGSF